MERAVRVPCRGLAAAHFRPERNSFSDTRPLPAKSFKPHAPYSLSGAPFSGHIMTAIDRRLRKPERAHRCSNSDANPDPAIIQLVGAFRAYPQLTSIMSVGKLRVPWTS